MLIIEGRSRTRALAVAYWTATGLVCAELVVGGIWDIARLPLVRETVAALGYPAYFLVILGVWKVLGGAALLAPRFARLKEWAYAGVVFADTCAIASHLWTGTGPGEIPVLAVLLVLTVVSWATRPPGRVLSPAGRG